MLTLHSFVHRTRALCDFVVDFCDVNSRKEDALDFLVVVG